MQLRRIALTTFLFILIVVTTRAQEAVTLSPEEIQSYNDQSKQLPGRPE
jgi:hypothetical protein